VQSTEAFVPLQDLTETPASKFRRAVSGIVRRWRTWISVFGAGAVAAVLAAVLAGRRGDFTTALHAAPLWLLGVAALLQAVALVSRTEAWHVCVGAAGGTVGRRPLFRAASIGYLGTLINGQFGVAVRIAALRRSAPAESPRVPAMIAAELPILTIEATLAALTSFTLVGPLGLPWWLPLVCIAATLAIGASLRALSRQERTGFWRGVAVMRTLEGRTRLVGLVLIAVFAQIARNWLVLHALGINASVFDAIALLIGMVVISQLPVGPTVGAAAAVLILGTNGVAIAAAAGILLTATGTAGALGYMAWAVADYFYVERSFASTVAGRMRSGLSSRRSTAAAALHALAGPGHGRAVAFAYQWRVRSPGLAPA
jgi:hypothetical protein